MTQGKRHSPADARAAVYRRALEHPGQTKAILGEAAAHYERLARDPRYQRDAQDLYALAQEFGQAQHQLGAVDDFNEYLQETIEAHKLGAPNDFQLRAYGQQVREAEGTPRVSISPESWSRDTALGRYSLFKWDPTEEEHKLGVRDLDTLVIWAGLKHEAQTFTVDYSLANPPVYPPVPDDPGTEPTLIARPYGFVEFGSDGQKTRVLFDIGFGTRFTVAGNYIAAGAGMHPPPEALDSEEEAQSKTLRIGCSLGAFAAPSVAPVTYTQYVDRLGNGILSDPIQRPTKATFLLPLLCDRGGGSTNINFLDFNCKILYTVTWPGGTLSAAPIPLAPDVAYVRLLNNTGDEASYRVVFQLAL